MAVKLSAGVTDKGVKLALNRAEKAIDSRVIADKAAHVMVHEYLPMVFKTNKYGWPAPSWRSGKPLMDTATHLVSGFVYQIVATTGEAVARIHNTFRYAWVHDKGYVSKPKTKKYLTIPLSPPLGINEARTARASDYPGAFVLMKGPEGPGIYRKVGGVVSVSLKNRKRTVSSAGANKDVKTIERIFALVKEVKIPRRHFMFWHPDAKALVMQRVRAMVSKRAKSDVVAA